MVRRIVWTSLADKIFTSILEFYIIRNGSKTYSRKLNNEIHTTIRLLKKSPFLGTHTDLENIRVLIYKNYKVFYQVEIEEIIVHLVWDTRQNPQRLEDFLP
jgi:plasmid stabilization system protein ParE